MRKASRLLTVLMIFSLMFTLIGVIPVFAEDVKEGTVVANNTAFPDHDAHYQVTFTYKASSSSVSKVSLVGNFTFYKEADAQKVMNGEVVKTYLPTEYEDGMFQTGYGVPEKGYVPIEMTDIGNDYYQITLPLPGTLYFYGFVEDDDLNHIIKDKTNMPVKNGDSDCGWSYIYVGNSKDCLEGQEYIYPRADEKKGSLSFVEYTAVDGSKQPLGIYLPQGYNKNETYKTLYLSHGGGGNEVEWMYIGSAVNIMDNLIAEGLVEKTILVTMDNTYLGNFDMEKVNKNLIENVIPYVEANYSVSKKAEDRAMAGLSNGAWATVNEMVVAQDSFGYYGIFSPNYRAKVVLDDATKEQLANFKNAKLYYECSGTVDDGMGRQDRYGTVNGVRQILEDNGANVKFEWKHGAHDWGVWRACLTTFVKDYLWTENKPVQPEKPIDKDDSAIQKPATKEDNTIKRPATGDATSIAILSISMMASLIGAGYVYLNKKEC